MGEPRDTVPDVFGSPWEEPTPKVLVVQPTEFLLGAVDAHNVWFKYLQSAAWKLLGEDGQPRQLTAQEAADIVQTVRNLQGV